MSDKNLAQAILYDAGKAMYNDGQLAGMTDPEVRRAGAKNVASFAGYTALTGAVIAGGYLGLHHKFEQDTTPTPAVTSVSQEANAAPQPVSAESVDQVPSVALGNVPEGQTTYVVTPPEQ